MDLLRIPYWGGGGHTSITPSTSIPGTPGCSNPGSLASSGAAPPAGSPHSSVVLPGAVSRLWTTAHARARAGFGGAPGARMGSRRWILLRGMRRSTPAPLCPPRCPQIPGARHPPHMCAPKEERWSEGAEEVGNVGRRGNRRADARHDCLLLRGLKSLRVRRSGLEAPEKVMEEAL